MKICIQVVFAVILLSHLSAQVTLNEDFESYNNGDLITIASSDWLLWPKGNDSPVTNELSMSGSNSLKLEGTRETDIYFPFKHKFTAGSIDFSMYLYIPKGSNGYFSLQGLEEIGKIWSLQCYLDNTGFFRISTTQNGKIQNAYPQDQWFKFSIAINLDSHLVSIMIDDECVGSYLETDPTKQSIASLALYPDGDNSLFYVDDIDFQHRGTSNKREIKLDAEITEVFDFNHGLSQVTPTTFANINGTEQTLGCLITNRGLDAITALELSLKVNDKIQPQIFDVNLSAGADTVLILDATIITNGVLSPTLAITQVNGIQDHNNCNDKAQLNFQGFTLNPDKKVWIEEATGTWCPWCPRGHVYMGYLSQKYPDHFVGISTHHNDPMQFVEWSGTSNYGKRKDKEKSFDGLASYLKGFPSVLIERAEVLDPNQMELAFLKSASEQPLTSLSHSAQWNAETRELQVTVSANTSQVNTDNVKLIVGLTEDKIKRKGIGWEQQNFYSGGQESMSGFEQLPNPVPDTMMVYNHVAKHLLTPFKGESLEVNAFQQENNTVTRTFTHQIPGDWNLENINIVSGLMIESERVDNANKTSVLEAIENEKSKQSRKKKFRLRKKE